MEVAQKTREEFVKFIKLKSTKFMLARQFEDIIAWQKSEELSFEIYNYFKSNRDFSFRDQIQRAAISIMNNNAEGYERKGNKEFRKFLYIAKGSCAEVRSMLSIAKKLEYITLDVFNKLHDETIVISKLLSGFIRSLT